LSRADDAALVRRIEWLGDGVDIVARLRRA
jgi:hypothetical protein